MEFSDVIKNRYSCKKFSSEQIGKDKLDAILEAGRVAPTAKNLQEQHLKRENSICYHRQRLQLLLW